MLDDTVIQIQKTRLQQPYLTQIFYERYYSSLCWIIVS